MRNSNKVLLIAAVALLGFILTFVVVMGLKTRNLFEGQGPSASGFPAPGGFQDHRAVLLEHSTGWQQGEGLFQHQQGFLIVRGSDQGHDGVVNVHLVAL